MPNPVDGALNIFAWIKGDAPGQVIISQESGLNWLMADPIYEALKTDLKEPVTTGRGAILAGPLLISLSVVADSHWYRIGFVWNGSNRILYVDYIKAARDTANKPESASSDLYIGTGKAMELGAYRSGLINDVRIYSRAVSP